VLSTKTSPKSSLLRTWYIDARKGARRYDVPGLIPRSSPLVHIKKARLSPPTVSLARFATRASTTLRERRATKRPARANLRPPNPLVLGRRPRALLAATELRRLS